MDIKCPNCKAEIEAPEEMAGEVADCPGCQHKISIPKSVPQKKKAKTSWRDQPATMSQMEYLESLGIKPDKPITGGEAGELIDNQPASRLQLNYLKSFDIKPDKPITKSEASALIDNAIACNLPRVELDIEDVDYAKEKTEVHKDIENVKKQIADSAFDDKIKKIKEELASSSLSKEDKVGLSDELKKLKNQKSRLKVKLQKFKDELSGLKNNEKFIKECYEDRIDDALELFELDGKYFAYLKKPTKKQMCEVIETLDKQYSDWQEKNGDEPILATLQTNFPELIKKSSIKNNSGCLGTFVLAAFPALLIVIMLLYLI